MNSAAREPVRLFCFHHAGGAASVYAKWSAALRPGIKVVPVQLPGRESRRGEAMPRDLDALVAALDTELSGLVGAPYAFYGHSMGGTVAYQLAKRRADRGAVPPVALMIGACPAPHLRSELQDMFDTDEDELVSAMLRIGGLSPAVLQYPEWLRAATDLLRADLRVLATGRCAEEPTVAAPLHLFHGTDDPLVSEADVLAWTCYTSAECVLHTVEGGHFFVRAAGDEFFRMLGDVLAPLPEPTTR